ncbi:hypothetical protein OF83DRAFT_1168257 [Amylostereum chailletii]|nr:hypothetical protein OF83DRAFT_1168257 [Amylostereum chailletii]
MASPHYPPGLYGSHDDPLLSSLTSWSSETLDFVESTRDANGAASPSRVCEDLSIISLSTSVLSSPNVCSSSSVLSASTLSIPVPPSLPRGRRAEHVKSPTPTKVTGGGRRKRSCKRPLEGGRHIPRTPNSFILFRTELSTKYQGAMTGSNNDFSRFAADVWNSMSDKSKTAYRARSRALRAMHSTEITKPVSRSPPAPRQMVDRVVQEMEGGLSDSEGDAIDHKSQAQSVALDSLSRPIIQTALHAHPDGTDSLFYTPPSPDSSLHSPLSPLSALSPSFPPSAPPHSAVFAIEPCLTGEEHKQPMGDARSSDGTMVSSSPPPANLYAPYDAFRRPCDTDWKAIYEGLLSDWMKAQSPSVTAALSSYVPSPASTPSLAVDLPLHCAYNPFEDDTFLIPPSPDSDLTDFWSMFAGVPNVPDLGSHPACTTAPESAYITPSSSFALQPSADVLDEGLDAILQVLLGSSYPLP